MSETNQSISVICNDPDLESLLVYLECRAVDHSGRVNSQNMNAADFAQAQLWNDSGFIRFGRIAHQDCTRDGNYWVQLSRDAFTAAAALRQHRAERGWKSRRYITTDEKRNASV